MAASGCYFSSVAKPVNKFKIGIFAANCSGGNSATAVPERWQATWEGNLKIAQMADAAGLEFMLPLGRWGGPTGHGTFLKTSQDREC